MAMDFTWLPPGTDQNRLPLGMRANNPGNIKYFKGLNYPGMLGPSGPGHTDQGDPQMTFDTPQSGMSAMATLARKKYQGGKRSAMDLIAGQMGWTPGNTSAAANVARTMGIDPNADMNLNDPKQMSAFLRALTQQEHGASAKLYGDDLYQNAATSAVNGQAMPVGTNVGRNLAPSMGGIANAPVDPSMMAFGSPLAQALMPPDPRNTKMADAFAAQSVNAQPQGWGDLVRALSGMVSGQGYAQKAKEEQKAYQSKLSQMLAGATTPEALSQTLIASGDPDLVKQGVTARLAQAKPKSEIGRFRPTKQGVVDTTTGQIVPGTEQKGTDNAEYGTSTKAFEDKDGSIQYMQFSKAGGGQPVKLPEGARWRPDVEIKDTGTEFVPVSKQTGQVIGAPIAKDVAGKQAQEEIGKARGQAIVDLPKVEGATNVLTAKIDQVLNDPYLAAMTGPVGGRLPNLSGDASRVQSRIDQLTGDAFLQAFGELKGGGAITEIEGAKAEKAKSRLATMTVNDPEYPVALKDFRDEVERLRDLARARAGGGSPAAAPAAGASAPASGGYKVLKVY